MCFIFTNGFVINDHSVDKMVKQGDPFVSANMVVEINNYGKPTATVNPNATTTASPTTTANPNPTTTASPTTTANPVTTNKNPTTTPSGSTTTNKDSTTVNPEPTSDSNSCKPSS